MSILAERPDPLDAFETAHKAFVGHVVGGATLVALVLFAPKTDVPPLFRLGLTTLFFLGAITTVWGFGAPLETLLRARLELSLEDFGSETRALGHVAIDALSRYLQRLVLPLTLALCFLFLRVFAAWPMGEPLAVASPVFRLGFWLALGLVPVHLLVSTNRLMEIFSLWRVYGRQLERSRFKSVTIAEARARADELAGPPVVLTGSYEFRSGGENWSWSDFQKNAIVFGMTGSGKTITVLNSFLDGLLSSANGQAGTEIAAALILDPKGDYREKISVLCGRLGRRLDLHILDPSRPSESVRWNPLDSPDDALEISARFAGVMQLLGMKNTQDTFWIDTAKTFLRHAIALLRATEPPGAPPSFAGINEIATRPLLLEAKLFALYAKALFLAVGEPTLSVETLLLDMQPSAVLDGFSDAAPGAHAIRAYFRRWNAMRDAEKQAVAKEVLALSDRFTNVVPIVLTPGNEALLAAEYLANTWLSMPEKTRGSVQTQITNMIDPFIVEPYRTVFSGRSTVKLGDVLDNGHIFYVYMPSEERSEMSRVVNTLVKLEFYREVLRRRGKTRPSLFLCDEFQSFFTSDEGRGDGPFFERSRESFHANVVATQNLSTLLREAPKEETVHSFLGNCAVKMFLRNTEGATHEFATKHVFGEYLGFVVTAGASIGEGRGHHGLREGASINVNAQTLPVVAPDRMMHLAIPDRQSGSLYAEALVQLASRDTVAVKRLRFKVHPLDA